MAKTSSSCFWNAVSGGDGATSNGDGVGGSTSGGHTVGGSNTNIYTITVSIGPSDLMIKDFIMNLTDAQEDWYNDQTADAQLNINNFLISSNTPARRQYIINMIDVCMENDLIFQFSNDVNSTNSFNLTNFNQIQTLINENCITNITSSNLLNDGDDVIATTVINVSPLYSLKVMIKQKLIPYSVQNVTSQIEGLVLGVNWTQTDYGVSGESTSSPIATVNLYGTTSYSIFLEGIGTYLTKSRHYILKIDKSDGRIIARICP